MPPDSFGSFGRRGLLIRGLMAGILIVLMSGTAVAAVGLLQVKEIVHIVAKQGRKPIEIPNIDRAEAGKPETLLLLGSDIRYADRKAGNPARSDTIMLVRLDPDKNVIALLSIPRDLLTTVPGVGLSVKINSAYEAGGEKLMVTVLKNLFATAGDDLQINHVITMSFGAFSRAVNYVGCVYADIDRHYFNDNSGPGAPYATIDIKAGYQRLCGGDALDYVRYRHGDNDLLRTARQQDFLRQIRTQDGVRQLATFTPGNLKKLAALFARYFDADRGLRDPKQILSLAKLVLFSQGSPLREVRFQAVDAPDHINLVASPEMLHSTLSQFLRAEGSSTPRATPTATPTPTPSKKKKHKHASSSTTSVPGLVDAQTLGENQALPVYRKTGFPMYFPTLKTTYASYIGTEPRLYTIRDYDKVRHRAYRMVAYTGTNGEYYGIQGTTWMDPPILDDPSTTISRSGRKLKVYRDGKQVRMVSWRTSHAVYWVSNTLTQSLTSRQMIAIAGSLTRFH